VKLKLASWKASLLSITGRVQLVKSVVQSMLLHTMAIYSWPVSLLRDIEKWIKKFIWSGDITKRKLVTVAWKNFCASYEEGGLNIRSLVCLNEATNLKLCWDLLHSQEQWAYIPKSRVLRDVSCIKYHIYSSIWSSIKMEFQIVRENSTWLVGDGNQINFLFDSWCGDPLQHSLNASTDLIHEYPQKLSAYIANCALNLPTSLAQVFPDLRRIVNQVTLLVNDQHDCLVWKHSTSGNLTLKNALEFKKHHFPKFAWTKSIWSMDIPPFKSFLAWRLMHNKLPTNDNLATRGCSLPSMRSLCKTNYETSFHLEMVCIHLKYQLSASKYGGHLEYLPKELESSMQAHSHCCTNQYPQCYLVLQKPQKIQRQKKFIGGLLFPQSFQVSPYLVIFPTK